MPDLRWPSGMFFGITGIALLIAGYFHPVAPMTGANVDLYVGLAMIAFSAVLLALARRGRS